MNIKIIDGVEHWDIAAEEIVIEAPIDGASVRWHFRPYAVGSAKALLKSVANKYKLLSGGVTEAIAGDQSAYAVFFDAHFLKMSNVTGADGKNELSLDDQKSWLADNPQIKSDVVALLFKPEPPTTDDEYAPSSGATVLTQRTSAESMHRVKCWHNGATIELTITHHMNRPAAADRLEYDRSINRNRMNNRHNTIQIIMDYDLVEKIYDRLVVSLSGACIGDDPCAGGVKKIEWIKRVPFWWKTYAVDDVFGQDRIKNA